MNFNRPPEPNKESIVEKQLEAVENATLESGKKLDLTLLLLDKKEGAQLGKYKIVESEADKEKTLAEFSQELSEIMKVITETGLRYHMAKELSDEEGMVGFSVLLSKTQETLEKFVEADKNDDDKTFGLMVGYPKTAVEAYNTDKAFNFQDELSVEEYKKIENEGLLSFLHFKPSKEHWAEELEFARENQRLVKEKAPLLYQELTNIKE
ncbi:MAG TPA: hypothetical protein PK950_01820 [Candidatus Paceibacterota bacterium]|nr:hypothetical protein [Candidatus Paceibacterota bacterium]